MVCSGRWLVSLRALAGSSPAALVVSSAGYVFLFGITGRGLSSRAKETAHSRELHLLLLFGHLVGSATDFLAGTLL